MKRTEKRILHLVVKAVAYDMIAAGIKLEEYREIKEFWTKRFVNKSALGNPFIHFFSFDVIRFRRGYTSTSMDIEFKGIRYGEPNPEWTCGIIDNKTCFVIRLGKIIKRKKL